MAHPRAAPHGLDKTQGTFPRVGAVVTAHDLLDGLTGLVGIVEGNGGDVVVQNMGLDDAVEKLAAHEAKLAVDRGGGATDVVPRFARVVWERGVCVLKEGDGN